METTSLHLNHTDDATAEADLRRILKIDNDWIAWGGDTGAISYQGESVRHWDEDDDVRAVAVHGSSVAIGLESGSVLAYYNMDQLTDFLTKKNLTSVTGPILAATVRQILFYDADTLVIASEDGLCLWNIDTNERWLEKESIEHHKGSGIRSIALHKNTLASLAMDGFWCLWDLEKREFIYRGDRCVTKKDVGETLGADPWDRACQPVFFNKNILLLPGESWLQVRGRDGKVYDDTDAKGHVESIVACAVQGKNIISIARDKRVVLWSMQQGYAIKQVRQIAELESAATDVVWGNDGSLRLACANGELVTFANIELPSEATPVEKQPEPQETPVNSESEVQATKSAVERETAPSAKPTSKDNSANNDDSDDDMFNGEKSAAPDVSRYIEDEADDDDDSLALPTLPLTQQPEAANQPMDNNDHMSEDEASIGTHDPYKQAYAIPHAPKLHDLQDAFAPSATPLDLDRRFLCWNHVGSIVRRQDSLSSVDIHFTNSGFHRPITMTDTMGFILGSLGDDGAIFCTDIPETEDNNNVDDLVTGLSESVREAVEKSGRKANTAGSSVFFHRFDTFASLQDKDWCIALPSGELALGCATGEGWAAVMTSRRFVRVFSTGGNQGNVHWLEGNPVTMAGHGRFLACVYHRGEPLRDGSQQMGCLVLDVVANRIVSKGPLSCLSSASSLTWLGFSNDSSLLAMDSNGMLSMLVEMGAGWDWMPMLDTLGLKKSSDDSFWPISVFDGKLICVPLKGGKKHPEAARKPVTTTLGFRIPLARGLIAKTVALEEVYLRATVALGQKNAVHRIVEGEDAENDSYEQEYQAFSAQLDKVTLKMFAATIEAGKLERALDLVRRLNTEKSFELAMTIADNHRKLVDKIEEAMNEKFGAVDDEEYEESIPRISPDSRKRPNDGVLDRNARARVH